MAEAKSRSTSNADELRRHILRGILLPGEHLGQAELAVQFKTSKVPVREALRQLHAEGLLDHDHNRGYFVARLSFEEGIQLYRMRRWIEQQLLLGMDWPSREELKHLRALMERVSKPHNPQEREAWFLALEELRHSIFSLSKYKVLLGEAVRLWTLTDRYRALLPIDRSPDREPDLVDALEARDREALLTHHRLERERIEIMLADVFDVEHEELATF